MVWKKCDGKQLFSGKSMILLVVGGLFVGGILAILK
jgi:hypothetical protein